METMRELEVKKVYYIYMFDNYVKLNNILQIEILTEKNTKLTEDNICLEEKVSIQLHYLPIF